MRPGCKVLVCFKALPYRARKFLSRDGGLSVLYKIGPNCFQPSERLNKKVGLVLAFILPIGNG